MIRKLSALAIAGAAPLLALGAQAQAPDPSTRSGPTLTCRLTSGPRAGTSFDFTGTRAMPARAGRGCSDMSSRSEGVVVAPGIAGQPGQHQQSQGRYYQKGQGQSGYSLPGGYTFLCHFTRGPRAGTSFDFTRTPDASSARVGSGCSDGAGSTGVAVPPGPSQREWEREGPY